MKFLLTAFLMAATLASVALCAEPVENVDAGRFVVYLGGKPIGIEIFSLEGRGDSLNVFSKTTLTLTDGAAEEPFEKQMVLVASRADFGLLLYQSNQKLQGQELIRGVVMGDTAFTVYREVGGKGLGDRLVLPPGRLFILDSQLYTLFDLICLSLHDKTFTTRPISLLTLGARDSLLEATAKHLGTETIRWGEKPMQARKLSLSDGNITFTLWAGPDGKLLRLEHGPSELRVERDPPAVKRRTPPQPGG